MNDDGDRDEQNITAKAKIELLEWSTWTTPLSLPRSTYINRIEYANEKINSYSNLCDRSASIARSIASDSCDRATTQEGDEF